MTENLYQTLGVTQAASDDEIRKAYRKLAKTCHPDTNPGDKAAEDRFKAISRAYAILGDPAKRKRYDKGQIDAEGNERGPQGFPFGAGGPFGGGGGGGRGRTYSYRSAGPGGGGFAGFDDILSDLFGGAARGGRSGGRGSTGEDLKLTVTVDFLDAAKGAKRRVGLPDGRHLDVTIPAGVEPGQVLRLKGQGVAGGDALIDVQVSPHEGFRRDGLDIHLDHAIPLDLAIAGGKATVPTIDGNVVVTVPPWTSSGKTLRLKGRGIARGGHRGDQLVRLEVALPTEPDATLRQWAKSRTETKV